MARCGSSWVTTAWAWTRRPAGAASSRSSRRKGSAERDWAWRWSTASPGGNGEIDIDSAVGRGTTVSLNFPVPPAAPATPSQDRLESARPSRLRLLLVDDDPLLLKSLCNTLEADGHIVVTANSGVAGIAAFRAASARGETFAAVITDLGMPNVDGRKVASSIKTVSPATPVIMLTGWGKRLMSEDDIPPHVDHLLSNPPKLRELRETLARCCAPDRAQGATVV